MPEQSETGGSIKDRVAFIFGEIGAARGQRHPNDDDIIAKRIDRAYDALEALLKDLYGG